MRAPGHSALSFQKSVPCSLLSHPAVGGPGLLRSLLCGGADHAPVTETSWAQGSQTWPTAQVTDLVTCVFPSLPGCWPYLPEEETEAPGARPYQSPAVTSGE